MRFPLSWSGIVPAAIVALCLFAPAETPAAEKEKATAKTAASAKPAAPAKTIVSPRGGTVKVQSTKASGASIVAKSKSCVGETPQIVKVKPDEGKAGETVTITGRNFGSPGCMRSVSFGPGNPAKFTHESDSTVTATVPSGKRGNVILTLTTASGEDSKPFLAK
jgi:hypothetical protein